MAIHKEILECQAAHPNTTWLAWGVTWLVILSTLFWPLCGHSEIGGFAYRTAQNHRGRLRDLDTLIYCAINIRMRSMPLLSSSGRSERATAPKSSMVSGH